MHMIYRNAHYWRCDRSEAPQNGCGAGKEFSGSVQAELRCQFAPFVPILCRSDADGWHILSPRPICTHLSALKAI